MPNTKPSAILDRLLARSLAYPLGIPARYAVASLLIIAVGLLRAGLIASIVPWLLFIPAVLAVALMLGRAPGLYASVLAAVVAGLSIGHASEPLWLTPARWSGSILFVAVSAGIAILGGELRAAFARATRLTSEKDDAHALLAEREAFLSSVLARAFSAQRESRGIHSGAPI